MSEWLIEIGSFLNPNGSFDMRSSERIRQHGATCQNCIEILKTPYLNQPVPTTRDVLFPLELVSDTRSSYIFRMARSSLRNAHLPCADIGGEQEPVRDPSMLDVECESHHFSGSY